MKFEEKIFNNYEIYKDKLITYGFKKKNNKLVFEKLISDNDFKVIVEFDKNISGKIYDMSTKEEYTNFRLVNSKGFSSTIKEEFIEILQDIRENCCNKRVFQSQQGEMIKNFIKETFNDNPEFLWQNLPTYAIFRKKKNNKWYAIIGTVPRNKVDKSSKSTEIIEIVNIKADKATVQNLLKIDGIYEAYHMNKKSWITIILDNTLEDIKIKDLIINSYKNV